MGSKKGIQMMMKKGFDLDEFERELGVVCRTGAMGKKRIMPSPCNSPLRTPLKRQCSGKLSWERSSLLEALPQDILVKISCGVEHGDLAQLIYVSKQIKDAALIAKELHFAFRTPLTKTAVSQFGDVQVEKIDSCHLNAPKAVKSSRSRASKKNLADITVALFRSFEEE